MENNQIILSLDIASKKTGYAIYKEGYVIKSGTIILKPKSKYKDLYNFLSSTIESYNITRIISEDIYKSKSSKNKVVFQILAECRGVLELCNQTYNLPQITFISSVIVKTTILNYVSKIRSENKTNVIRSIKNRGFILEDDNADDEADAIALLITFLKRYEINPIPI